MTDMTSFVALRRDLHRQPDLSGQEGDTATRLVSVLERMGGVELVTGLGGHGVAAIFAAAQPGPTIMLRAELDALPIVETSGVPHRSERMGIAHLCGHDGHMAILMGVAQHLSQNPPPQGRVILLFQPAEETGAGARAVLADPRFENLQPDWAFALHNMPGMPLGALACAAGPASCASVGIELCFQGIEAHAAFPETGRSPAPAMTEILRRLEPLRAVPPMGPEFRLATLCHMSMGVPAFGIAPASGRMQITLRAQSDAVLETLEADLTGRAQDVAASLGLTLDIHRHDHFHATQNDARAAEIVAQAGIAANLPFADYPFPMRPSEDFGAFSGRTRTALFFLGAGPDCAPLHNPAYDFPDALILPGVSIFTHILHQIWASEE